MIEFCLWLIAMQLGMLNLILLSKDKNEHRRIEKDESRIKA